MTCLGAPLKGIRVVFVDMDLGVGREMEAQLGHLMTVLRQTLDPEGKPLVFVTWSAHPELVAAFEDRLPDTFAGLKPIVLKELRNKEELISAPSSELVDAVLEQLKALEPLTLLWHWEQRVHDATTETTRGLSLLIPRESVDERWLRRLRQVIGALGHAAGGGTVRTGADAVAAALSALSPIMEDRLEQLSSEHVYSGESAGLLEAVEKDREHDGRLLNDDIRGALNRMLLLARGRPEPAGPVPGNIYVAEAWTPPEAFVIGRDGAAVGGVAMTTVLAQAWRQWGALGGMERDDVMSACTPATVEFTADCDFAQDRVLQARLMSGFFVPSARIGDVGDGQHLRRYGPLRLTAVPGCSLVGSYWLVFSALHLMGCAADVLEAQLAPYRVRRQALADLQSWFAAHASRPGMIKLP
jgi:hypothetical protein